jgi:hypothetical protein
LEAVSRLTFSEGMRGNKPNAWQHPGRRLTKMPDSVYKPAMAAAAVEFLKIATDRRENWHGL